MIRAEVNLSAGGGISPHAHLRGNRKSAGSHQFPERAIFTLDSCAAIEQINLLADIATSTAW